MKVCKQVGLLSGAAALALTGTVFADGTEDTIARLEARVAELEAQQGGDWLTEQRAEQIKGLVHDVIADADTRSSLLQSGMTSGYNNGFYLGSSDGNFSLTMNGHMQTRFIYNNSDENADDDHRWGFENSRTKLIFSGNAVSPDWTYKIEGDFGSDGDFSLLDAYISWDYGSGWSVRMGQFKRPFLREELVDSRHQLAVERSGVNEIFTGGRTQGIAMSYASDTWRLTSSYNDGDNTDNTPWSAETTEYSLGARAEFLLQGNWDQFMDFTSPNGDEQGIMVGVAVKSQVDEYGTAAAGEVERLGFTVDGSFEFGGANLFAAFVWDSYDDDGAIDADLMGFVVQGGMYFNDDWEGFIRYEYVDFDLPGVEDASLLTIGVNRYFSGHNLKWTTDLVWGIDEVPIDSDILGLRADTPGEDGQLAIRSQLQLAF